MARTDTINAANVVNEVQTVFPGANSGRTPGILAVKDGTLQASAKAVINTAVVGHLDIVIDSTLATNGWEARDRVKAYTAAQQTADARIAERRRQPFEGGVAPYGGGANG